MILERTLPNGLELVVNPTNAPVAAIQVWVDVGSIDEKPAEAGYCHFLEHMLFKGTKKRTTSQIAGSIEGAGGDVNAFTSFEYTVYHITLSNQRWELANEILCDMLLRSTFLPSEFNPEKEVILEEIRRGDDSPDRQLYRHVYELMYGKQGYGRPVIGYPKTVSACSASGLKQFWKKWYAPSLMTVVVCGDVDPVKVESIVKKTWGQAAGKAPRLRRRELGFDQRVSPLKDRMTTRPFPVNAIRWVGALPACSLHDAVLPALDVSSMILGQGESSRLYSRLFRDEAVVTSIGAGVWAPAGKGMYSFEAEASLEKAGQFRKFLSKEIERFCAEGPTSHEIERAKATIESERIYGSQSMDGLANRFGFLKTTLGNVRFDLEYIAQTRELASDDIRDAARRYLDLNAMREFALLPKDFESKNFWDQKDETPPPTIRKPSPRSVAPEQHRISLSNGIELLLYPRTDLPLVSVQACALGGLRSETRANAGLGNILAKVWEKGPQGWTAMKFAEYLEARAARIDAFSGRNSLGLSATMLTQQLENILPLFAESLLNPALLEEELKRAQTLALEDIRTLEDDLGRLVGRLFCESLFEGHPYAQPLAGYSESVSNFSTADLKLHFNHLVSHAPLVVSISGKFNPNRLISVFEKLPRPPGSRQDRGSLALTSLKAPRLAEVKKQREQSHLIVGFQGTTVTDADRYSLKVLLTVLGGQSGRLFTELRDKQALCYTVAPIFFEGIEPGYVGVYMGCNPAKLSQALQGIKAELDRISHKAITASELKRAKEFVLGRHHMDMQLNSSIASVTAFNTLYGLGSQEHLKLGDNLKKVTVPSIQKVAAKIFGAPSVTALVL